MRSTSHKHRMHASTSATSKFSVSIAERNSCSRRGHTNTLIVLSSFHGRWIQHKLTVIPIFQQFAFPSFKNSQTILEYLGRLSCVLLSEFSNTCESCLKRIGGRHDWSVLASILVCQWTWSNNAPEERSRVHTLRFKSKLFFTFVHNPQRRCTVVLPLRFIEERRNI